MSATLAVLLTELDPNATIHIYERLPDVADESSNPWRNAGTGHAALCELNYTPEGADGSIEIAKAVAINEQFGVSRELWDHLAAAGLLDTANFLSPVPHMTFVRGAANVDYLRRRHEALTAHPRFAGMEFTQDPAQIAEWTPLLMAGRADGEPVAATRAEAGTDVDFGALTRALLAVAQRRGVVIRTGAEVRSAHRTPRGWRLTVRDRSWSAVGRPRLTYARFVFVGAGGGALTLLQTSRIPEIKGFAGFPISGMFLRTFNPDLVAQHEAKVYGKADVGAPPMSVPHLDTRVVDGKTALMFGPFAGFSLKFLAQGGRMDALKSIKPNNLLPMLAVARDNLSLVKYLITEVLARPQHKLNALRAFFPKADPSDWTLITAGQRVQVIKPDPEHTGVLQFGTEVITSADGSIAGLLGASPGASTAAFAMAKVIDRCFGDDHPEWTERLTELMPSLIPAGVTRPRDRAKPGGPV